MHKVLFYCLLSLLAGPLAAQSKQALMVGISNYRVVERNSEWSNMHGTNDVALIAPILRQQGFTVTTLTEGQATCANILKALTKLTRTVRSGATVYLHFSCHGQPFEDLDGDEEDGWDESIVPVDAPIVYTKGRYEGHHHITDDRLASYLNILRTKLGRKGHLYVVIDACHAGRSSRDMDDETFTRGTKRGFSPNGKIYRPRNQSRTHFAIPTRANQAPATFLEACKSMQVNTEIKRNGTYYGPLSYYISRVIAHTQVGADNGWAYRVQELMRKDLDTRRQDMVIESSH